MDNPDLAEQTAHRWAAQIIAGRQAAKLTQAEFATAIGVSNGTVCAWEQGRRTPSLAQRRQLVELLKLDPADWRLEDHCPRCGYRHR